jgi:hypothetical protein
MQSGYGAMSKLNTLLGVNPNPNAARLPPPAHAPINPAYTPPNPGYAPTPGGGVHQIVQTDPHAPQAPPDVHWNIPEANMGNLPLNRILMIRAQNGDRQAQQMLQRLS